MTHNAENDADLNKIARAICDSEPFMWLMVGSNHTESQLAALRDVWREHYLPAGGGYGARARRVTSPGWNPIPPEGGYTKEDF